MSRGNWIQLIIYILLFFGLLLFIVGSSCNRNANLRMEEFTVKRATEVGKEGQFLVFTEGDRVFQNQDAWLLGKFNSSDLQSQMDPGDCFKAKVAGWRVHILSWYPNIIELYPCEE